MAEVPRIVRERLSSQATAGEHPDANLLSAFAEHALTEQERAQVLDHLSRCAECRQVVALATLPQVEEERLVAAAAAGASAGASRSWWRSPIVHWGALTAAALVVLIAVATRMQLRQGHSASAPAIATASSNEVAQKSTMQAREVSPPAAEPKQSGKPAKKPRPVRDAKTLSAGRQAGAVGGGIGEGAGGVIGGKVGAIGALSVTAEKPVPSAAPPSPPAMKAQASADAGMTGGPRLENKIQQAQAKAAPAPSAAVREAVEVTAAAPGPKSEAAVSSQRSGASFAKRAALGPRWSVSDSGVLQRSLDGGRSWKEVPVADGVTFRAVATVGNDVWAGGSGGALLHSADGGERWSRVRVQANGRTLSGDIVRIEFTDAADGVVATSAGETWATSDAGGTWRWQ